MPMAGRIDRSPFGMASTIVQSSRFSQKAKLMPAQAYCKSATTFGGARLMRRSFPKCCKYWCNPTLLSNCGSSGSAICIRFSSPRKVGIFHQPVGLRFHSVRLISTQQNAARFRRDGIKGFASTISQQLDRTEEEAVALGQKSTTSQVLEPDGVFARATKASSKVCASCVHSKHIVDFEKRRGSDLRSDLCRACLAAIRAERVGVDMHHLSLNVEESWERAKSCARCGILKELRDFGRNIRKAEGIEIYCRACKCQMERQQPDRLPAPESTPLPCNRCGETKPGAEFALDKKRLRGRAVICKQCFSERRRQLYRRHRDAEVLARTQPKHCIECGEEKAVAEFHRNRAAVDGLQDKCKACCNAYNTRRRAGQKARRENGAVRDSGQGLNEGDDDAELSEEALEAALI